LINLLGSIYCFAMGNPDIESSPAVAERMSVDIDKSQVGVGREQLSNVLPPHDTYEGGHRWDPSATWTPEEEKRAVRKTDLKLLSWLCLMVCCW
jgi:hypothetical protein